MWCPHSAQHLLENPEFRCATNAAPWWNARLRPWRSNLIYHCHTLEIILLCWGGDEYGRSGCFEDGCLFAHVLGMLCGLWQSNVSNMQNMVNVSSIQYDTYFPLMEIFAIFDIFNFRLRGKHCILRWFSCQWHLNWLVFSNIFGRTKGFLQGFKQLICAHSPATPLSYGWTPSGCCARTQ